MFFFFLCSHCIFDDQLCPNVHRFIILCTRWDTPSENTGLWQLPNMSGAFTHNRLETQKTFKVVIITTSNILVKPKEGDLCGKTEKAMSKSYTFGKPPKPSKKISSRCQLLWQPQTHSVDKIFSQTILWVESLCATLQNHHKRALFNKSTLIFIRHGPYKSLWLVGTGIYWLFMKLLKIIVSIKTLIGNKQWRAVGSTNYCEKRLPLK